MPYGSHNGGADVLLIRSC